MTAPDRSGAATDYLELDDFLRLMERTVGAGPENLRDVGLVESALARPRATAFGEEVYPEMAAKAAALFASVCANHALVDGNKRMAWVCLRAFLLLNGLDLRVGHEEAYAFVIEVAAGRLRDVPAIAEQLAAWTVPAHP